MAEKGDKKDKPKPQGFHAEFGWFIWGLVGLGFIWFFTGGPVRDSSHEGAYIKPPAPLDSGEIYGKYYVGPTDTTKQKEKLDLPQWPGNIVLGFVNAVRYIKDKVENSGGN